VLAFALLVALPAATAQAKIKPLPRPAGIAAKPPTVRAAALIAPVARPATRPTVIAPPRQTAPTLRQTARVHAPAPLRTALRRRRAFVPATSHGGRERPWRVLSSGGRQAPVVAGLVPTPLALVGAAEALPAADSGDPSWTIAALLLLALGEAFVLLRLACTSRWAQAGEYL
jgi:hypothetical protein